MFQYIKSIFGSPKKEELELVSNDTNSNSNSISTSAFIDFDHIEEKQLICNICLGPAKMGVVHESTNECDSLFCQSCIDEYYKQNSVSVISCPCCKWQDIHKEQWIIDRHRKKLLLLEKVKCAILGCNWTGTLAEYNRTHIYTCSFRTHTCKWKCSDEKLTLEEKNHHENSTCQLRQTFCTEPSCQLRMNVNEGIHTQQFCLKYLKECPNKCYAKVVVNMLCRKYFGQYNSNLVFKDTYTDSGRSPCMVFYDKRYFKRNDKHDYFYIHDKTNFLSLPFNIQSMFYDDSPLHRTSSNTLEIWRQIDDGIHDVHLPLFNPYSPYFIYNTKKQKITKLTRSHNVTIEEKDEYFIKPMYNAEELNHHATKCPFETTICCYDSLGCNYEYLNCQFNYHLKKHVIKHANLVVRNTEKRKLEEIYP